MGRYTPRLNLNRGEKDEVLEVVDTDEHAEKELDDGKVVKIHKIGKKVEHKCGQDQLEPSPVIRSRHRATDDTEVVLQQRTTKDVPHRVLANQSETEENKSALDSQVLNYDEYAVDAVHDHSYASEEAREYDEQYDAQSLGTRSDNEQFDEDGDEPETSALSEEQLEEKRNNGK